MSNLPAHDLEVIGALVDDALAAGHSISIFDGEEWALKRSTDKAVILAELAASDEDTLRIRDAAGAVVGTVYLVYGNEPGVVISDHSDTEAMTALLARADKIADRQYNKAA